jgi:L-ascorbate metabolism protein UlaG (beta-lactamase superfamily)
MEELPKIDYILISHDHYDHLDLSTLEMIVERDHPMVLAGLGVMALLPDRWAPNVQELDWWRTHQSAAAGTVFTFVPARHSSGRWPFMENLTLWGGFVIESPSGEQVYYAGDTGYGAFLESIRDQFKRVRLAFISAPLPNTPSRPSTLTSMTWPRPSTNTWCRRLNSGSWGLGREEMSLSIECDGT